MNIILVARDENALKAVSDSIKEKFEYQHIC